MAADFNTLKAAAVAILAMIYAVVDVASDVSVCFHVLKPPFCFDNIFAGSNVFIPESVLFF